MSFRVVALLSSNPRAWFLFFKKNRIQVRVLSIEEGWPERQIAEQNEIFIRAILKENQPWSEREPGRQSGIFFLSRGARILSFRYY